MCSYTHYSETASLSREKPGIVASDLSMYSEGAGAKAIVAELQAISYSLMREKAPIYTMGSPDPRSYSRNKRGIAGSLIWVNFDRHALLNLFYNAQATFVADTDEIRPQYQSPTSGAAVFSSSLVRDFGPQFNAGTTIDQMDTIQDQVFSFFRALCHHPDLLPQYSLSIHQSS